ncbi:DUF427 domain-containing protein [uncultured Shewanella sp.]|uniref:DUF427 domain-containing protein n=1 Tax=uncultured Shewanella sp. TaxID=173975 RepID=UPI00261D7E26|nr:DUF427 domain-containing protein [uncultured Shewanella sp.]
MSDLKHYAKITPASQHIQLIVDDVVIAESEQAIIVNEISPKGELPPVWYIPVTDINDRYLTRTDLHTFCPIKGEASYYSITVNGIVHENAVWYYSEPLVPVAPIKGYASFDASRVCHKQVP